MEFGDGMQFSENFKSIDNVFIYFTNLSPYYIFSVVVSILAVISVCWFRITENKLEMEPVTTDNDVPGEDSQEECDEEPKIMGVKLKESLCNLENNFVEPSNNDEFFQKDLNGLTQEDNEHGKDTPGGDGNFQQYNKDTSEMKGTEKLDGDKDYSHLPSPITRFKKARQAALYEKLTNNLSEQQLQEEKETEASQIAAIWGLLREQKEQFNIGTEEELKDQLHLYRL